MRIIDLSRPLYHEMPTYPGDPEVTIEVVRTIETHRWELRQLSMGSHTGTHVDAPSHMHANSSTLDDIPLHRFMGRAVAVTIDDSWPEGLGLLFLEPADVDELDRILDHKPPFVGGPLTEALERKLLERGIITYTNLINLELLPRENPFIFIGLPLSIRGGDGSPVRAVAIIDAL